MLSADCSCGWWSGGASGAHIRGAYDSKNGTSGSLHVRLEDERGDAVLLHRLLFLQAGHQQGAAAGAASASERDRLEGREE